MATVAISARSPRPTTARATIALVPRPLAQLERVRQRGRAPSRIVQPDRQQDFLDGAPEFIGHIGPHIGQLFDITGTMGRWSVFQRPAGHGMRGGEKMKQQHAKRIDVARLRRRATGEHLRREVQRRTRVIAVARRRELQIMARAKVHENDAPAGLAHDVLRLDVAVEKAGVVHRGERLREVGGDGHDFVRIQSASLGQELLERTPLDEFGPDADGIADAFGAVHRQHVRVTDACQEARFVDRTRG